MFGMVCHLFQDWHFLNFSWLEVISHIIFIGFFIEIIIIFLALFGGSKFCMKVINFQFQSLNITKNE